jgi:hypothetical protein
MVNRVDIDPKIIVVTESNNTIAVAEEMVETGFLDKHVVQATRTRAQEINDDAEYEDALDHFEPEDEDSPGLFYVENDLGGLTPRWLRWAEQVAEFSETTVGKMAVDTAVRSVGQKAGMALGTMFPAAPFAYATGKALAEQVVPDSENRSTIVQAAGMVAGAASVALTYGTPMGYIATAAGAIYGGRQGMEGITGEKVSPEYEFRTATSMVTTGVVGVATSIISYVADTVLPAPVSVVVSVAGGVLNAVSGTVGYNAPELFLTPVDPRSNNIIEDPAEFVKIAAEEAGGTRALASAVTKRIDLSLAKGLASEESQLAVVKEIENIITETITASIDGQWGVTSIVRAVNKLSLFIKDEEIQAEFKAINECQDVDKKAKLIRDLRKKLIQIILKDVYGKADGINTDMMCEALMKMLKLDEQLDKTFNALVPMMRGMEQNTLGTEFITDKSTPMLEVFAPALLLLMPICAYQDSKEHVPLSAEEKGNFNINLADMLLFVLTPLEASNFRLNVRGALSKALSLASSASLSESMATEVGKRLKAMLNVEPVQGVNEDVSVLNLATVVQKTAEEAGGSKAVAGALASKVSVSVITGLVSEEKKAKVAADFNQWIAEIIGEGLDSNIGANAFVRAVNAYVKFLKDPAAREMIKGANKDDLKKLLVAQVLKREYNESDVLCEAIMEKFHPETYLGSVFDMVIGLMQTNELKLLGGALTSEQSKETLEAYTAGLIILLPIYLGRERAKTAELTDEENKEFVHGLAEIVFSAYQDTTLGKVAKDVAIQALDRIAKAEFLAQELAKVAGETLKTSLGVVPVATVAGPPREIRDMGDAINSGIGENRVALDQLAIQGLQMLPFAEAVARMITEKTVAEKVGPNALVRAMNEYADVFNDGERQAYIEMLKGCKNEEEKKRLKEEIVQAIQEKIRGKYGPYEKIVADVMQSNAQGILKGVIQSVIKSFKEYEIKFLGDLKRGDIEEDLLDIYLPTLVPMFAIYASRAAQGENEDLSQKELGAFYGNLGAIIACPYESFNSAKDLGSLMSGITAGLMRETDLVEAVISKYVEDHLKPKTTGATESEPSFFMTFLSYFTNLKSMILGGYDWVISMFVKDISNEIDRTIDQVTRREVWRERVRWDDDITV